MNYQSDNSLVINFAFKEILDRHTLEEISSRLIYLDTAVNLELRKLINFTEERLVRYAFNLALDLKNERVNEKTAIYVETSQSYKLYQIDNGYSVTID